MRNRNDRQTNKRHNQVTQSQLPVDLIFWQTTTRETNKGGILPTPTEFKDDDQAYLFKQLDGNISLDVTSSSQDSLNNPDDLNSSSVYQHVFC